MTQLLLQYVIEMSAGTDDGTLTPIQTIILSIISGGLVGGLFSLLTKKSKSPESQNDLARLGNEFARQLLEEARTERTELRLSIKELKETNDTKADTIKRLESLLQSKDNRIEELEDRQQAIAEKLQNGEKITLADIFGKDAPEIHLAVEPNVA